jgi:hypothetical protein
LINIERKLHPLLREDITHREGSIEKKKKNKCNRDPQGDWRQDEVFGCKPPVVKYLHPLEARARKVRRLREPGSRRMLTSRRSYQTAQ